MMISRRYAQQMTQIKENMENLGSPNVSIEPEFKARIEKAVNTINQNNPGLLNDVTVELLESGPFGRFTTTNPHTVYVNISKLESEIKSRLAGQPEDVIQQELDNQIVKTIMHEATHRKEVAETGTSSESGPDAAEDKADSFLPKTELQAVSYRVADLRDKLKKEEPVKEEDGLGELQLVLEDTEPGDETGEDCPHMCYVISVEEARDLFRDWITDNHLTSEDAPRAFVHKDGQPYKIISYNGRMWNLDGTAFYGL